MREKEPGVRLHSIHMIPAGPGVIRAGDPVEVLESA